MSSLAQTAHACELAQALYRADADQSQKVLPDWHALDYQTRHAYVDKAVEVLNLRRVVPFPAPVQRVDPADLVPRAVRDIQAGIADLINAANAAESLTDANDLQAVISDLQVQLQAASMVAYHREQQFYPKGA